MTAFLFIVILLITSTKDRKEWWFNAIVIIFITQCIYEFLNSQTLNSFMEGLLN